MHPHPPPPLDLAPPDALTQLPDQALLDLAVHAQVARNRGHAHQIEVYAELRRRCEADHEQRRRRSHAAFVLTPLDETAIEISGALGVGEARLKLDVYLRDRLLEWFPGIWSRCLTGRLDLGRAQMCVDAAERLADPDDVLAFAAMVEDYLERYDDPSQPLCTLSYTQLSRALRYRRLKFEQKRPEECFAEAFSKRRVWLRQGEDGISGLGTTGAAHDLLACDYRLTLIARKRCQDPDDARTLAQMRADTMVDLLLGRLTVGALDSELEDDDTVDGRDPAETFAEHPVGDFARPLINVVVPVTALLGTSDEPGFLSGDLAIPAELARQIALEPRSTWYRLLTDEVGDFQHLSTTSYAPSRPIWRHVVARDRTCVWPRCQRPAVECESDHRLPFPEGKTCVCELDSLCRRHHHAKHSEGYQVWREGDGTYVVRTRRGSILREPPCEQPYDGHVHPGAA